MSVGTGDNGYAQVMRKVWVSECAMCSGNINNVSRGNQMI